jgi:lipopolysaccharide export system protein LptC
MARNRRGWMLAVAGAALAASIAAGPASSSADPVGRTGVRVGGTFYTIETTAAHYNVGSGAFETDAPLRISRPGLDATADAGRGNTIAGTALLRGNVRIHDAGGAGSPQGKDAEPATLTCDELTIDARKDTYRASGHARFIGVTRTAQADLMVLDRKHHTVHFEGDVTLTDGDAAVHASVVDLDLAHHESVALGSPVVIVKPAASPAPATGTSSTAPRVGTTASPASLNKQ